MLANKLWSSIKDIFSAIMTHPFIKGLTDGSLDEEKFRYYIVQDYLYLKEFSKALAILSSKSEDVNESLLFSSHVQDVFKVERSLHEYFISEWNIDESSFNPSPTNLLYTSFLISTVLTKPYYIGVVTVLPCYWIYMEVGKELIKKGSPNKLYQKWIQTYGGEEYEKGVKEVINIANRFNINEEQEKEAIKYFRICSIFEYMFWDSAYKLEKFPFNF